MNDKDLKAPKPGAYPYFVGRLMAVDLDKGRMTISVGADDVVLRSVACFLAEGDVIKVEFPHE